MNSRKPLLAALVVVLLPLGACTPPKRDYSVDQIQKTDDLEELMYVQATIADKLMRQARGLKPDAMTDEQFAAYEDMGVRLGATATQLLTFNSEEGWQQFSTQFGREANLLAERARAKDGPTTLKTALAIKETCANCHDEYR